MPRRPQRRSSTDPTTARPEKTAHAIVVVRECIAVALYHILIALAPVIVQRAMQQRPHALAVAAVSLWWTFRVTRTLPHLVLRIAEQRLGRANIPHLFLLVVIHLVGRSAAMLYFSTTTKTTDSQQALLDFQVPWRLFAERLPLDCLRMTFFTLAMLVVPVLLQVNRIAVPGWFLLFLLLIPTNNDNETTPQYDQPIIYYLVLHVLSGFLAGRWMQWSFPDDPGSRATLLV